VYALDDAPGGGFGVTFRDPIDAFPFHLVYGQASAPDIAGLPQLQYNLVRLSDFSERFPN
jgi:hypothetical protein